MDRRTFLTAICGVRLQPDNRCGPAKAGHHIRATCRRRRDRTHPRARRGAAVSQRSEEHTSELQSHHDLVCRLLLEKKKKQKISREPRTSPSATTRAATATASRPRSISTLFCST